MNSAERLETLLARVRRNRERPRGAPAILDVAPTPIAAPDTAPGSEMAEFPMDLPLPPAVDEAPVHTLRPPVAAPSVALVEPGTRRTKSDHPTERITVAHAASLRPAAPLEPVAPSLRPEPMSAPAERAVEPERVQVPAPAHVAAVARVVAPAPVAAPRTFGTWLARSLALRLR